METVSQKTDTYKKLKVMPSKWPDCHVKISKDCTDFTITINTVARTEAKIDDHLT